MTHNIEKNKRVTYNDVAKFTWHYWSQRKRMIPSFLALMGVAAFMDTLFPLLVGHMVDEIMTADKSVTGFLKPVLIAFAMFVGIDIFYHLFRNGSVLVWNKFAVQNLRSILGDAFHKVQRFSTDWHANNFAGATVRKITRGMWAFDMFGDILFFFMFPTAIVMVSTIAILTWHWPVMGLVTLGCVIVYIAFSMYAILKVNAPLFEASAKADTEVGAALADAITANSAVKTFGTEQREDERFAGVSLSWHKKALHSWQVSTWTDLVRRYISVTMMAIMVGMAIHLWLKEQASAGDVVYVFTSFMVISGYLRNIGEQISNMQKSISDMEDVIFFWMQKEDVRDAKDAVAFKPGKGEIIFDDVQFTYDGQEQPLYDDFSLTITPGEKVALVGHSGSGKSTFVKLVQRLYDIQSGEIRIDGQNIAQTTQASLRQAIALVPQEPILFHRSLAENIAYSRPEATMDEIIDAAEQAYAHEFIKDLPKGYDTLVGERGVKLSGGERQRVAIARAILADAPILILDEATSSLDSVSEHYIQKALQGLMENRTTITIAHRLATIRSVDRILVFDKGEIVEQGRHDDLIIRPKSHYRKLYEMQALDLIGPPPSGKKAEAHEADSNTDIRKGAAE